RSWHGRGLAEPDHDAAHRVPLAEVDVRLLDRALEATIAERVVDDSASVVDVGAEAAARDARDRAPQVGRDDRRSGGVAGCGVHLRAARWAGAEAVGLVVGRRGSKTEGESGKGCRERAALERCHGVTPLECAGWCALRKHLTTADLFPSDAVL